MVPPTQENYKNIGWFEDIGSFINLNDLIVVPNEHAYFDLLPIESLLLNVPVAVTPVGGNIFLLENFEGCGVYEFPANFELNDISNSLESLVVNTELIARVFSKETFVKSQHAFYDTVFYPEYNIN